MGNNLGILTDESSFVGVPTDSLIKELFLRLTYTTSPYRILSHGLTNHVEKLSFTAEDFEHFSYLFGRTIDIDKFCQAFICHTPELASMHSYDSMRTELLGRTNAQIRHLLEKTVCTLHFVYLPLCLTLLLSLYLDRRTSKD